MTASAPRFRTPGADAFRTVKWLVGAYATLSVLTVAAVITFSIAAPDLVTPPAQVRSVIVAATSLLTVTFARRAARGNVRALLRLRIVVTIILIAIAAVLFFLPLPAWMVVEQAACGLLLAVVAALILRPAEPAATRRAPEPALTDRRAHDHS
jgi:membrane associated rhomboid family serine protease